MKDYLLALLGTALALAAIGILTPDGTRGGIAKHVRLVAALVWILVLVAPLSGAVRSVRDWVDNGMPLPFLRIEEEEEEHRELWDTTLDEASTAYFCDMLTQTLEKTFEITPGDLTCRVRWVREGEELRPETVTLLLSGQAIWQSPHTLEEYVEDLLNCDCEVAIE